MEQANRFAPGAEEASDGFEPGASSGLDEQTDQIIESRIAARTTVLIRAAKIVSHQGEFVCVVRDVSESGVSVKLFHKMPDGDPLELHMASGAVYELRTVWQRGDEAGFEFTKPVDVARLINEAGEYPKRGLRLGLIFPATIKTLAATTEAVVENFSQQGARFESEERFAIEQPIRLNCPEGGTDLKDVRAKIRWRRENMYGVVFDDTLTLRQFARVAARLQCPRLLD